MKIAKKPELNLISSASDHLFFNKRGRSSFFPETHNAQTLFFKKSIIQPKKEKEGITQRDMMDSSILDNPLVGLKRGDGIVVGTWNLRSRVMLLQQKLNEKTGFGLNTDGMFGPKTGQALSLFKSSLSITNGSNPESYQLQMQPTENVSTEHAVLPNGLEIVDPYTANALQNDNSPKCDSEQIDHWNFANIKSNTETQDKFCILPSRTVIVDGRFWRTRKSGEDFVRLDFMAYNKHGRHVMTASDFVRMAPPISSISFSKRFDFRGLKNGFYTGTLFFTYIKMGGSKSKKKHTLTGSGLIYNDFLD